MANTAMSTVSTAIVRKGQPITRWATLGANTYIPGDWLYFSATLTATAADSDVAASLLMKPSLLDFVPRINNSTKARLDIDNDYQDQTTAHAAVITGGLNGPLHVAATCEDPGAALIKTSQMMISDTAGDIEVIDSCVDPTGGCQLIYVETDLANGDTVGLFILY